MRPFEQKIQHLPLAANEFATRKLVIIAKTEAPDRLLVSY